MKNKDVYIFETFLRDEQGKAQLANFGCIATEVGVTTMPRFTATVY